MIRQFIFYLFILFFVSGCADKEEEWPVIKGETMGTYFRITYDPSNTRVVWKRLQDQINVLLSDINHRMSTYIEDSELSLLNQVNLDFSIIISEELFYVLNQANRVSEQTAGAFDVTVGALVNLWGFGPDPLRQSTPSDDELRFVKQHVGYQKLLLDESSFSITKTEPLMYIDLSGIAKGYAVDQIARHLESLNIQQYLVDIGGELVGKGNNQQGIPWQIGIEKPETLQRDVQRIIKLENMGMATSGDYRNYFEQNGVRYSHTIDPTTGKPITHNMASVTVLHQKCILADAYATAFMVMGPEKSMTLADELGLPVYMIVRNNGEFEERYNDAFNRYFSDQ